MQIVCILKTTASTRTRRSTPFSHNPLDAEMQVRGVKSACSGWRVDAWAYSCRCIDGARRFDPCVTAFDAPRRYRLMYERWRGEIHGTTLVIPKFASEAEEARWWFGNQDAVADEFELGAKEGRLGHGRALQRALAAQETRLEPEDALLAWRQAESRRMEYRAYLKMVVHRALLNEAKDVAGEVKGVESAA